MRSTTLLRVVHLLKHRSLIPAPASPEHTAAEAGDPYSANTLAASVSCEWEGLMEKTKMSEVGMHPGRVARVAGHLSRISRRTGLWLGSDGGDFP